MAAEGHLQHNGSFKVSALGMPPSERREESIASAKVVLDQTPTSLRQDESYLPHGGRKSFSKKQGQCRL